MNDKTNGKLTLIELSMVVDEFIKLMPAQIQDHVELSKLYKARFDSLVAAGFKEKQALDLIKARGFE